MKRFYTHLDAICPMSILVRWWSPDLYFHHHLSGVIIILRCKQSLSRSLGYKFFMDCVALPHPLIFIDYDRQKILHSEDISGNFKMERPWNCFFLKGFSNKNLSLSHILDWSGITFQILYLCDRIFWSVNSFRCKNIGLLSFKQWHQIFPQGI